MILCFQVKYYYELRGSIYLALQAGGEEKKKKKSLLYTDFSVSGLGFMILSPGGKVSVHQVTKMNHFKANSPS